MGDTFFTRAFGAGQLAFAYEHRLASELGAQVSVVAPHVAPRIKEAEGDGSEANAPAAIGDRFEAHQLVSQANAEAPLSLVHRDDAV